MDVNAYHLDKSNPEEMKELHRVWASIQEKHKKHIVTEAPDGTKITIVFECQEGKLRKAAVSQVKNTMLQGQKRAKVRDRLRAKFQNAVTNG